MTFLVLSLASSLAFAESDCPDLVGRWSCFNTLAKTTIVTQRTNPDSSETYDFTASYLEGGKDSLFSATTNNSPVSCYEGKCISTCQNIDGTKVLNFYGIYSKMKGYSIQHIITPIKYSSVTGRISKIAVKTINVNPRETVVYEGDCSH